MGNNRSYNNINNSSTNSFIKLISQMIVGSIKENYKIEKRVSITPETSKNLTNLGLEVILEKNYANHLGISDKEYEKHKVKFLENSNDINFKKI